MERRRVYLSLDKRAQKFYRFRPDLYLPDLVEVARELLESGVIKGEKQPDGNIKIECNEKLLKKLVRLCPTRRPMNKEELDEMLAKESQVISGMRSKK